MIIYFSGDGMTGSQPENVLPKANIMLTYWSQQKKPEVRFRSVEKARAKAKKRKR